MDPVDRTHWLRRALVVAAGIGLAYFGLAVSMAGVLGERRPEVALDWRPADARAHAALAARMLGGPDAAAPEAIKNHALAALRRDPTAIDAVRVLATLDMQSDPERAGTLMKYALALSRRDLPTHMWFIEDYARRASVAGALFHYDAALRTSRRARSLLLPVLASASSQPKVVAELDPILARDPSWRDEYIEALVRQGDDFDAWIGIPIKYLDVQVARETELVQTLLNRLVAAREYRLAERVHDSKAGPRGTASVRNGEFDQQPRFTPFDWILVNEQGFSAQVDMPEGATDPALILIADNGRSGPMASQMLRLETGRYRISVVAGGVQQDGQLDLALRCVETNEPLLRAAALRSNAEGRPFGGQFTVPAGSCPAQWLDIGVTAAGSQADAQPWVDSVAVAPVR